MNCKRIFTVTKWGKRLMLQLVVLLPALLQWSLSVAMCEVGRRCNPGIAAINPGQRDWSPGQCAIVLYRGIVWGAVSQQCNYEWTVRYDWDLQHNCY